MLVMDESTFQSFYKNTVFGYSKQMKRSLVRDLNLSGLIQIGNQISLLAENNTQNKLFFPDTSNEDLILDSTALSVHYSSFYESFEFDKLYKYSVPFFYSTNEIVVDNIKKLGFVIFDLKTYIPNRYIAHELTEDIEPLVFFPDSDTILLKFVTQKHYLASETLAMPIVTDYRYPIVISINLKLSLLEIRYDAYKYSSDYDYASYESCVHFFIAWLKKELHLKLYSCDSEYFMDTVKADSENSVKVFRQMMALSSGGAAELTAANGDDCILPFVGEIKQLIEENEELFSRSTDVKDLLLKYIYEKESTAEYPYVYLKWNNSVETKVFIVKVTFNQQPGSNIILQHLTGKCKDLRKGRMDDALRYLCESKAIRVGVEV